MRLAIVQTQPAKGHYTENLARARDAFSQVSDPSADLVLFPEAAMTGYFLEGAVYELARSAGEFAADLAQAWRDGGSGREIDIAAGFYENDGGTYYNSAVYLHARRDGGEDIVHVHRKMFLPTYGVFDEERFLSRGRKLQTFATRFGTAALLVCEDAWHAIVPAIAALKGARLLLIPSASPGRGIEGPEELSSIAHWRQLLTSAAIEHGVFVAYAGLTGFEGGKGMTGSSCAIDPWGKVLVQAPATEPCIVRADLDLGEVELARAGLPLLGDLRSVLPDLLLDDELPLPRIRADAADR